MSSILIEKWIPMQVKRRFLSFLKNWIFNFKNDVYLHEGSILTDKKAPMQVKPRFLKTEKPAISRQSEF